jgi:hypothetical protein
MRLTGVKPLISRGFGLLFVKLGVAFGNPSYETKTECTLAFGANPDFSRFFIDFKLQLGIAVAFHHLTPIAERTLVKQSLQESNLLQAS